MVEPPSSLQEQQELQDRHSNSSNSNTVNSNSCNNSHHCHCRPVWFDSKLPPSYCHTLSVILGRLLMMPLCERAVVHKRPCARGGRSATSATCEEAYRSATCEEAYRVSPRKRRLVIGPAAREEPIDCQKRALTTIQLKGTKKQGLLVQPASSNNGESICSNAPSHEYARSRRQSICPRRRSCSSSPWCRR